ncbi:MAG: gliding motility-associated C-terminal domain-containing protein, partial [Flavobacteriales bacterium]
VQNSCGEATSTTLTIQVEEPVAPIVAASASTTLCEGDALTLSTSATGTYQWRVDGTDLAGEASATLNVVASGSYTVIVDNGICAVESTPVVVSITPLPVAELLTTDTEVCVDENMLLEAAPGFSGYQWIENGVVISTLANYAVITSNPGTFNLELTANNNGCTSAPLPITVIVHPFPVVQITPAGPLELCPENEVVLNSVNTHQTYQWYEDGAPTATTATLNVAYQQASSIRLEATDNGCTSTSNVVTVVSNEVATIATWNAPPYAENNTLPTCLDAHPILGVSDGAVIQWFRDGAAIPGANGLIVNATADGDYYFSASITGQCPIYSDTIAVELEVDMSINTTASKDTACEGEIVQIIPQGNFVSYSWSGGIIADTLLVTNTGTYIVTGHLVSCFQTDTVDVFFSPYPAMTAGDDFYSDCGVNTMLYGQSDGDETYWEIDGFEVASGDTVAITTPTRTTELVMISALNGCESRDTVNLIIDCVYIYAPTAITPDGDGLNDVFRVYANGLSSFVLRIFDRYGQVVWETNDPDGVWTGGSPDYYVPNGVYTWQIEALDYNQEQALSKERSRGSILVIR